MRRTRRSTGRPRSSSSCATWSWFRQQPLDLEFLPPDPVRLVPVQLCVDDPSVRQPNRSKSFHLPPTSPPVELPESGELADAPAYRHRFDTAKLSGNLEIHA